MKRIYPRTGPVCRKAFGSALLWIIAAVVILAIALAATLVITQRRPPAKSASHAHTQPGYNHKKADHRLANLQQSLTDLMVRHHNPAPLIAQIRGFTHTYPTDPDGWKLLGQALSYDSQPKAGYAAVARSLKLDADQPGLESIAGTLAMQLGHYRDAAAHYGQAVSLDPSTGRYRVLLASAQVQMQQYSKAEITLLTALKLDSSLYQAHAELSSLYAQQDKLPQALDQIKRAIAMIPDKKRQEKQLYIRRRAKLLIRANRFNDALSVLENLPLQQVYSLPVLKQIAVCYELLGKPAQAAANYEKARVYLPENKHVIAQAIHWHLKAGQVAMAAQDLSDIRNIAPDWPEIQTLQKQIDHAQKSHTKRTQPPQPSTAVSPRHR